MALRPDRDKGTFPTCGLEMLVRIATLDLAPTKGETAVLGFSRGCSELRMQQTLVYPIHFLAGKEMYFDLSFASAFLHRYSGSEDLF